MINTRGLSLRYEKPLEASVSLFVCSCIRTRSRSVLASLATPTLVRAPSSTPSGPRRCAVWPPLLERQRYQLFWVKQSVSALTYLLPKASTIQYVATSRISLWLQISVIFSKSITVEYCARSRTHLPMCVL